MKRIVMALCFVLATAGTIKAIEPQDEKDNWTDQQWDEYNKAAEKGETEAGGETDVTPPHKKNCKPGQYCPTIENGISGGKQWCLSKGAKCGKSHRNLTYKLYMKWGPWLDKYNGGRLAIHMANTMRTESEGDPSSKTKSSIKEVGLMSIKADTAERLDINACHPEANIWAAGHVSNTHRLRIAEKYPQIKLAPREDYEKLAGACGSIGSTRAYNIIDASGALNTKVNDKGETVLMYSSPHDRVLKWLQWKAAKLGDAAYSLAWKHIFGPIPGITGLRLARPVAVYKILTEFYPGGFPWEPYKVIGKPDHFPPFPGHAQHGQCWRWPEWQSLKPSAAEREVWRTSHVMPVKPSTFIEGNGDE